MSTSQLSTAQRHFISDNASGIHPEVMGMLDKVNNGHMSSYGNDAVTEEVVQVFQKHFGSNAQPWLMLTGTAANVIGLQSVLSSYEAVVCADCAHLHRDECGAPEKFIGSKLLIAPTVQGKLTVDSIRPLLRDTAMVHRAQPRVVSISQCSEWGTVYTLDEIKTLANFCHNNNLLLHMDGARLCNAAVALDCSLKEVTTDAGVDLLSFGGTKNGLLGAEAIVFLNSDIGEKAGFYRKQGMQLASKMRFIAAQLIALLEKDLWQRNASHANAMAKALAHSVNKIVGVEIVIPVETNVVFAKIPPQWVEPLQKEYYFAVWDSASSTVRWMTSFDTTLDDIKSFTQALEKLAH